MTEFVEYTTKENDRWDLIANRAYGNPYGYPQIIFANPEYRNHAILDGGIVLKVPVILIAEDGLIGDELLPPWRRSQ